MLCWSDQFNDLALNLILITPAFAKNELDLKRLVKCTAH